MMADLFELMGNVAIPPQGQRRIGSARLRKNFRTRDVGNLEAHGSGLHTPVRVFHRANTTKRPDRFEYLLPHSHISRRGETVLRDVTVVAVAVDTLIRLDGCEGSRTCLQNPYVASDEVNILPRTHEGDDLADPVGGCNAVCVDEGEYLP